MGKALGEQQNSSTVIKQMRKEVFIPRRSRPPLTARSTRPPTQVTWLRKTPLMGNNLYDAIHKHKKDQAVKHLPC